MTSYRYPGEEAVLAVTALVILAVLLLTAGATICIVPLVVLLFVVLAYQTNRAHHSQIIRSGHHIDQNTSPGLAALSAECARRLDPGAYELYVVPTRELNAYTFGISDPKVVVLYSGLLKVMDEAELRFVLGHELGHVGLNHAWLNTLLGGMSGVPQPFGIAILLTFAFRWWNRLCEFSADRAGLLACGSLGKATSALVKLAMGGSGSPEQMAQALALIDAQDDSPLNLLGETLSTHPLAIKRINQLREYAATAAYQKLAGKVGRG